MTSRFLVTTGAALIAAGSFGLTACGGSESIDREEFITEVGKAGVNTATAECAYSEIEADEALMAEMVEAGGYTDKISVETSEKLTKIMAKCLLEVDKATQDAEK